MNPTLLREKKLAGVKCLIFSCLILLPALVSAQLSVTLEGTSPTCNGYANGSIEATIENGTPPYNLVWSNGVVGTSLLQSLPSGTYGLTVTDAQNEMVSASTFLGEPSELIVDVLSTEGCTGDGSATLTASGGSGVYTYLWDNGATTESVIGLNPGLHCVTVTDDVGCQGVGCVTMLGALELEFVISGLACTNFCDASVEALVTGGTAPYDYQWSNGANDPVNENLGPGDYSVTITDAVGCTISGTATVDNPFPITIDVDVVNPACGSGGTGSATASASGGNAPYSYVWSTGAIGASISGLVPGTYSVTATDFLGCNESVDVVIIPSDDIILSISPTPASDCGAANGSAALDIVGGTPPFDILWSNGATTQSIINLAPGTYTVMVTDANGCGASASVDIGGTPAIELSITGVNGGCASNGSANASVIPGTGTMPFSFLWSNGETTQIINDLTAGTYAVTVTDAAGCTATDQVTVTGASNISVSTTVNDVTCYNGNDGSAFATVSGATGSILFNWSNGESTQMIMNLSTGTYFVTVTDQATGCTATTNAFVGQPTEVEANIEGEDGICDQLGSAEVSGAGGTPPYTYLWNTGETSPEIFDLEAGTYSATVTDANGCTDDASIEIGGGGSLDVEVEITNPISGSTTNDGELTANVNGGTAPYTYLWNNNETTQTIGDLPGGIYSVLVTDVFGCTGTDTIFLEQLGCIGDYVWEDSDRDGCQDPGEFGVGGITVTLNGFDDNGNAVNMVTETGPNGFYLFENLPGGDYTVTFSDLPTNFVFTQSNNCGDDFTDSDVNASGSVTVDLEMGNCDVTVDAGIYDDCINISTPGEICCDQYLCGPGNDPAPITGVIPAAGGGSPIEYMWMFNTSGGSFNPNTWYSIPNSNSPDYDPGPIQETTYFIRCARATECGDWLESNVVEVFVDDKTVAEITGSDAVCVGDEVLYSAFDNGPGASYHWNFGPWATPSTSNDQNVTVTWNQAGVVYITLTVINNDCISTTQLGVAISDSPIFCGNALVINTDDIGDAVMVEWDIEQLEGELEYVIQRSPNGIDFKNLGIMPQAASSGMNHYAFADYFPKKGNAFYRVEMRKNGEHVLFSENSLVQRFDYIDMITFPNPTSDALFVQISGKVESAVVTEIFTVEGKHIRTETIEENTHQYAIDMRDFRSGAYILRFNFNDGEREIVRIMKQ